MEDKNQEDVEQTSSDGGSPKTGDEEKKAEFTQSELDQIVTKALKTREDNLRQQFEEERRADQIKLEKEKLMAEGKYKPLFEHTQQELQTLRDELKKKDLKVQTNEVLKERGLVQFDSLFDSDLSSLEGRVLVADKLQEIVSKQVEEQVAERLKSKLPSDQKTKVTQKGEGGIYTPTMSFGEKKY